MHWANNCLHNTQSVNVLEDDLDECEEVNIVLMTEDLDKNHGWKFLPQKKDIVLSERNNDDYSGWSVIFQFQKLWN